EEIAVQIGRLMTDAMPSEEARDSGELERPLHRSAQERYRAQRRHYPREQPAGRPGRVQRRGHSGELRLRVDGIAQPGPQIAVQGLASGRGRVDRPGPRQQEPPIWLEIDEVLDDGRQERRLLVELRGQEPAVS